METEGERKEQCIINITIIILSFCIVQVNMMHNSKRYADLSDSRWVCAGAFGGQWAGQLSRLRWFPLPLPNPTALPHEGKGELQGGSGWGERQRLVCRWRGILVWHLDWLQVGIFLFCLRSPPIVHKEEEGGGLHLLHGRSVCKAGEILWVEGWSSNTLQ